MFGVHIPSISDVKNAVTGAASTALHTTEDLGSSAVSHAASLGRSGLDLGRTAVSAVSHVNVQKLGSAAIGAIGKAEHWAEGGIQTGVIKAGQGVHSAADFARSHIPGDNPLSKAARGLITAGEDYTRFDIGVVGGVGKAAVGLVGSAGQLGVLAAEYQASPSARQAIDARIAGGVEGAAKSVAGYADSVAHDPTLVFGDAAHAAGAVGGWAKGEVNSARQAIKDGHGPESFGMQVGNAATYLIPVGGEARLAAEGGEFATRGLVEVAAEDATRSAAGDVARTAGEDGVRGAAEAAAKDAAPTVTDADIAAYRAKLGVPDTPTVAVGKTNIPGLADRVFEGASPKVLKEAGLPAAAKGPIASPSTVALFTRHAEEVLSNQVSHAIDGAGLKAADLEGRSLTIRVSQEVCATCKSGLRDITKPAGVLRQLSERYPGLRIEVTAQGVDKPIILHDGRRLAQ